MALLMCRRLPVYLYTNQCVVNLAGSLLNADTPSDMTNNKSAEQRTAVAEVGWQFVTQCVER